MLRAEISKRFERTIRLDKKKATSYSSTDKWQALYLLFEEGVITCALACLTFVVGHSLSPTPPTCSACLVYLELAGSLETGMIKTRYYVKGFFEL